MNIESDVLDILLFDNIIDDIAEKKNEENYPIFKTLCKNNDCN